VEANDPATFVPRLLDRIAGLRAGNLTNDDVTVLLFRPNGSAPTKPLKERCWSPSEWPGDPRVDRAQGGAGPVAGAERGERRRGGGAGAGEGGASGSRDGR
jgi:hypothetical protein